MENNFKEFEAYLLPTEKSSMIFRQLGMYFLSKIQEVKYESENSLGKPYHLYITDNQSPKDGEWVIDNVQIDEEGNTGLRVYKKRKGIEFADSSTERRIILTDNDSLGLQSISDENIRICLNEFKSNTKNISVLLNSYGELKIKDKLESLKVLYKENPIIKEELIELTIKAFYNAQIGRFKSCDKDYCREWINNLMNK